MKEQFKNVALNPGSLLVSTNTLDPYYCGAVVLLLAHNPQGSTGIILNKYHHDINYQEFVNVNEGIDLLHHELDEEKKKFLFGGPIEESQPRYIFAYEDQMKLYYFDSSFPDIKERFKTLVNVDTAAIKLAVNYSGWTCGNLEREIKRGDWRVLPYRRNLVFNTALEDIWPVAAGCAGLPQDWIRYVQDPKGFHEGHTLNDLAFKNLKSSLQSA